MRIPKRNCNPFHTWEWYVYLHLPYKSTIYAGKYASPMDPMGKYVHVCTRIPITPGLDVVGISKWGVYTRIYLNVQRYINHRYIYIYLFIYISLYIDNRYFYSCKSVQQEAFLFFKNLHTFIGEHWSWMDLREKISWRFLVWRYTVAFPRQHDGWRRGAEVGEDVSYQLKIKWATNKNLLLSIILVC